MSLESSSEIESEFSPEQAEAIEIFENFVLPTLRDRARRKIEQDYTIEKGFTYHNIGHTEFVVSLTKKLNEIAERYGIQNNIDSLATECAAWYHDSELIKDDKAPEREYKRKLDGVSEKASNELFKKDLAEVFEVVISNGDFSDAVKQELGLMINRIIVVAEDAIIGTIPTGTLRELDPDELDQLPFTIEGLKDRYLSHLDRSFVVGKPTVLSIEQEIINKPNSAKPAYNVTSADLFQVAAMTADQFERAGDGELHESAPFILKNIDRLEELNNEELEWIRMKILIHVDFQPSFTQEQWKYAVSNLIQNKADASDKGLSEETIDSLVIEYREFFPNFEARIVSSLDRSDRFRSQFPNMFIDKIAFGNNPAELEAFSNDNREKSIDQLKNMINQTRVPREAAV